MYEKTVELNPWQVYRAAKVVLAEMIEELQNANANSLELLECLSHNVSVQCKYLKEIKGDIKSFEDSKLNKMLKDAENEVVVLDMPFYC
jgi:ribosomal protein S8